MRGWWGRCLPSSARPVFAAPQGAARDAVALRLHRLNGARSWMAEGCARYMAPELAPGSDSTRSAGDVSLAPFRTARDDIRARVEQLLAAIESK